MTALKRWQKLLEIWYMNIHKWQNNYSPSKTKPQWNTKTFCTYNRKVFLEWQHAIYFKKFMKLAIDICHFIHSFCIFEKVTSTNYSSRYFYTVCNCVVTTMAWYRGWQLSKNATLNSMAYDASVQGMTKHKFMIIIT